MQKKILIGIPPKNHINLAMDEVDGLKNIGYNCETITYSRNNQKLSVLNKLLGVLKNAYELVKHLKRFQPDILYLNSRFEPVGCTRDYITLLVIKIFVNKNFIIAIKSHGSNFDIFEKKSFFYQNLVLRFLINNVDIWWFLSQDEKQTVALNNTKMNNKTYVTPNIIDPKRSVYSETLLKKYSIPEDKFSFLFVGRMVKEKGVFSIIKSIPLFEQRDKCVFIFIGNGDEFEEIKLLSKELRLEKHVRFLGFIPEEECDHFYANTDTLVFPSHDEGFAMSLFKSVACGMPILTTQIRAAKDHLNEPNNCLWVDGHSEQSIAKALNRIFENDVLRNSMAQNNVRLGQNFSKQNVTEQMQQTFSEVLKQ